MATVSEVCDLVRAERRRGGLTQRDLARHSGVPQPSITAIESDRRTPTPATLDRLLAAVRERPTARVARHRDLVAQVFADFGASDGLGFETLARRFPELLRSLGLG